MENYFPCWFRALFLIIINLFCLLFLLLRLLCKLNLNCYEEYSPLVSVTAPIQSSKLGLRPPLSTPMQGFADTQPSQATSRRVGFPDRSVCHCSLLISEGLVDRVQRVCVQKEGVSAEGVNLLVECLPSKPEGRRFNPQQQKRGGQRHAPMIPGLRVKAEASGVRGLQSKFQVSLGPDILSQRMGVASERNYLFGAASGVLPLCSSC